MGDSVKNSVKNIFLYIIFFFIVAMVVVLIVTETNQKKTSNDGSSTSYLYEKDNGIMIIEDKKEYSKDISYSISAIDEREEDDEVTTSKYRDIETLIKNYFDAVCTCDIEKIKSIVDTSEKISEEVLNKKAEYIEKYTNFTYYLKSGLIDNTYIVYVVYEVKFKSIEVMAPTMERFYIKENSDGAVYISRLSLNGTSANYLNEMEKEEEVLMLIKSTKERYQQACEMEVQLVELGDIMEKSIWVSE